ncbi:hypothetical protein ABXR19_12755 [Uliginosibacterium flavum]|uniref:Tellurite resistance protein TerB n=2 Tax=Uliginosibacterium flavum TaxID=1396831 RepID=A0ABV2TMC7_9RHOO
MRSYAKNSPEAAARFLVLTALADGDLDRLELSALDDFPALTKLGVDRDLIDTVLGDFCEDAQRSQRVDADFNLQFRPGDVARLLADIDRPDLQRSLCRAALSVIAADQNVHRGESILLWAALDAWDLQLANFLRSPTAFVPRFQEDKALRSGSSFY